MPALSPCIGKSNAKAGVFLAQPMKEAGGVAAKVEPLVRPVIEGMGLWLWDVRFEQEGGEWYLRILIDRDEPLDTDTCEAASRAIDPILDEKDPISQSYMLEVGSPGLGRALIRPEHFAAMVGKKIEAKLYAPNDAGQKEVAGILVRFDKETVVLQTENGEVAVPVKSAGHFKACDDEDLFMKQKKK